MRAFEETFDWIPLLTSRLKAHFQSEPRDGAHDFAHALRVAKLALAMAEEESADRETCLAAALLHDLVYLPKNHPEAPRTAALSSEASTAWCQDIPALAPRSQAVAEAILTHSFSSGAHPTCLEGAILQDADRLEALGAIGIARCFATGGALGASLWDSEDPWGTRRNLDDKRWSLDHFERKLLKLQMNTPAGRRRAEARHNTLQGFLAALREELG